MYINKETGEILTYTEAFKQWLEEYDGGDDTNAVSFDEIFQSYKAWLKANGFELDVRAEASVL